MVNYDPHSLWATRYIYIGVGRTCFCIYDAAQIYPELVVHLKRLSVAEETAVTAWKAAASEAVTKARATKLSVAVLSNPLIEFYESPEHPCKFTLNGAEKCKGKIIGKGEDEKIAVFRECGEHEHVAGTEAEEVVFLERTKVFPDERLPIAFPWKGEGMCFRAPHLSKPLMDILGKDVEGLMATKKGVKTTFLSVFSTYRLYGVAMFFIGGPVRHALIGDFRGINDVDVTYGQHPKIMKDIADAAGFGPVEIIGGIKTQWGSGKFLMEGNPIQSCSIRWTAEFTEKKSISNIVSNDLVDNLITMDFTCNSVAFDPVQDIFVDSSGYGLYDIQKKLLRATADREKWDLWYSQNKRKPFRYWKMRMLNYSASSNELHDFLCQKTVESLEDNREGGAEKLLNVICKHKRHRRHVLPQFKRLFCEEMNEAENRQVIPRGATDRVWHAIVHAYEKDS